ncbi:hypothetical protein BD626DRAFT_474444 [Schizophyllum amplum]|uniref:Uncharacterized protein n=1 Tax=Schizophyllum amplum TaxID=97359 RepID=A0A550CFF9_9AGAR|nr:hypothetical protein BD626DRAFT_494618 [Auriculariopsis ampla]TRM69536.1 hypothetical protein BD626DRAFT_474444 [Auriculariopsis ampla]
MTEPIPQVNCDTMIFHSTCVKRRCAALPQRCAPPTPLTPQLAHKCPRDHTSC